MPCTCRIITSLFLQSLLGTLANLDEKRVGSALPGGDGSHGTLLSIVMTWGGWKILGTPPKTPTAATKT